MSSEVAQNARLRIALSNLKKVGFAYAPKIININGKVPLV